MCAQKAVPYFLNLSDNFHGTPLFTLTHFERIRSTKNTKNIITTGGILKLKYKQTEAEAQKAFKNCINSKQKIDSKLMTNQNRRFEWNPVTKVEYKTFIDYS